MLFSRLSRRCVIGTAMCFALIGCIEIVEPSPPDLKLDSESTICPGSCSCQAADVTGRAFRFTSLSVEEPAEMAEVLNGQWAYEIENYLLNVIFIVNSAEQSATSSAEFSSINLTAGPGWRTPGTPYEVPIDGTFAPESYCLIDNELTLNMDVSPEEGAQCTFKNETSGSLYFHLGSKTDPLMCAPLLTPMNSTPILNLSVNFGFNTDCTAITNGYLTGCLPQEEVSKICLCKEAGTCDKGAAAPLTPFPADPTDSSAMTDYCRTTCGSVNSAGPHWLSLRVSMDSQKVTADDPECLINGQPGYRLAASFEASQIAGETGWFNPVVSEACLVQ